MTRRLDIRATAALLVALALAGTGLVTGPVAASRAADVPTYVNPVSKDFADTFADPSVIRGKDGWWWSYGTSDPLREGEGTAHRIPMAKSRDLVHWTYAGDAFSDATVPTWAESDTGLWAPDIRYVDGEYRMYYVVTQTTVTPDRDDNAIGMATAPTPHGPWADSGAPVVGPRPGGGGGYLWTFDPSVVSDRDGSQWLFYGSYYGGVFVQPLNDAGNATTGPATMVAIDNKFEGAYVVRHGPYWYLFASTANCCAGPTTGYSVQVGRSLDLAGPYVDAQGTPLLASRAGGTPVLTQNGNRWVGSGHNAIATDVAGQDFVVYHAIDRDDPYLDGTSGINERPMLIDRLDWVDGWPVVRAGRGPSDTPQPAPVTASDSPLATADGSILSGNRRGDVRVEGDLAGRASLVARWSGRTHGVRATVRPAAHELRLVARSGGKRVERTAPLPAGLDLAAAHSVVLQLIGDEASAALSQARLGDPLAELSLRLPTPLRNGAGRAGALAPGATSAATNVTVVDPAPALTSLPADDVPSDLVPSASDDFDGASLGAGWSWVREDPQAQVSGGVLRWPTEAADLNGPGSTAGVLLRDALDGDWAVETELSIDLGEQSVRNFQQAGLVVYVDDDLFTRLSHVAIWNTRQTEFGKEMPFAGGLSRGGTIVGPPAETTFLRITHHVDPANGEHELRAWTRRPGTGWVKGGVWTLPAGSDLRVGLVSQGRSADDPDAATARFDWFRTYR
jgi:arabinan endo-1,5-alpha-L-arabinosidase